ncbi:MAG: radical SAM protein [Myxococcales bacterium]|nr:radical SAM protein [Polyangiaceae bacterium]MDW8251169.1 radical SAM protein [Myxococcales bacterium]
MKSLPLLRQARWLEIAIDYRCNLRCIGCRACLGGDEELPLERALSWMRRARASGVDRLWIGGGEPTLRPELPSLLRAARTLGFRERLVQTNGLRLAYVPYCQALIDGGLTSLRLNLKSADANLHDELCRTPGAHALLDRALANLKETALSLTGDLLLTSRTLPGLPTTLRHYAARGIRTFSLWLLSAHDTDDPSLLGEIPSPMALVAALRSAVNIAIEISVSIESLHTPWCMLPEDLHILFRPAAEWGLVIIDPSDRSFSLEASPMEGGAYLPSCASCTRRPTCPGPRRDYLAAHGSEAFRPISPE